MTPAAVGPGDLLRAARQRARPASDVLNPADMGVARYTRHSFARSFLRTAAAARWQVEREVCELDAQGRGEMVYRVDADGHTFRFVAFSTILTGQQRTDRVIAEAWDVTAALLEGPITTERMASLRQQVPRQERGRADAGTLIWTRANRSARFFDYVVDRLTHGCQPDPTMMGAAAYVLRSTAFYSNGKFGLADFERFGDGHPLRVPYRAQMLAAWLLREFSYDLVEHCAAAHTPAAVRLSAGWRRYLGLGNATGLGMVPYVVNHPQVLDAWCAVRELPLAHALDQPGSGERFARVRELLARARDYFAERGDLSTEPYLRGPRLAEQLDSLLVLLARCGGEATARPWQVLHDAADSIGAEARGVLDTLLVEMFDELDDEVETLLRCPQSLEVHPTDTCAELRRQLRGYGWVAQHDFTDPAESAYFWYSSANNEEPRRGRRGVDPGEYGEHPLDIARAVAELRADLADVPGEWRVAEFLLARPWHRGTVARVQSLAELSYAELRANLLAADFLPLHVQRFQLALYGMDNYSPQSTDWLRVTLFSGAPRATDVADGVDDDWIFTRRPGQEDM